MKIDSHEHEIAIEIIFQALSSPIRLSIVKMLALGNSCVGAIACELDVSQTSVSQHLRVLRLAGIVETQKHGRFIHYRLNKASLLLMRNFFDHVYEAYEQIGEKCHAKGNHCKRGKGGEYASS